MSAVYSVVKQLCITVVQGYTNIDLVDHYGSIFTAKTKLADLGITPMVTPAMCNRTNSTFAPAIGSPWHAVGPLDTGGCSTIGDYISLVCHHGAITLPPVEPT